MRINILQWASVMCAGLLMASCDEDADKFVIQGLDAETAAQSGLSVDAAEVEITEENIDQDVLQLKWRMPSLSTDGNYGVANDQMSTQLQISLSENFANLAEENVSGLSTKSLNGTLLNKMVVGLGAKAGEKTKTYARLAMRLGANADEYFSNVVAITISPFMIVKNRIDAYNTAKTDVLFSLTSANCDGIYEGFSNVSAWLNCYLTEKDGTTWGNVGENGNYFKLTTDETMWNVWYPGTGGFYFTQVNTVTKSMTATHIAQMNIGGDASAEMKFNAKECKWEANIKTTADNAAISFSAKGNKYVTSDSEAAGEETFTFSISADSVISRTETATAFKIAQAGDYTVTLDFADAKAYKLRVTAGAQQPEEPQKPDTEKTWPASIAIMDADMASTLANLSQKAEGVYEGKISVTSWLNFMVSVGYADGTTEVFGSDPADQYTLSSDEGCYKCWFNDDNGEATLTIDLKNGKWSYTMGDAEPTVTIASVTILDQEAQQTLATLQKTAEGVYEGKIAVTSWLNFFVSVTKTDGTTETFGSDPADQYALSSAEGCYKCWFNDDNGEATVTIDLNTGKWSYAMQKGTPDANVSETTVKILDQDKQQTLATLEKKADGVYEGKIPVTSWLNFFVSVAKTDGTTEVFGSDPADQYTLSSAEGCYKCWFNDDNGEATVTIDTNTGKWSYKMN